MWAILKQRAVVKGQWLGNYRGFEPRLYLGDLSSWITDSVTYLKEAKLSLLGSHKSMEANLEK